MRLSICVAIYAERKAVYTRRVDGRVRRYGAITGLASDARLTIFGSPPFSSRQLPRAQILRVVHLGRSTCHAISGQGDQSCEEGTEEVHCS